MSDEAAIGRPRWLRPEVALRVTWQDRTEHGGPIGPRIEHTLREVFAPAIVLVDAGAEPTGPDVLAALAAATRSEAFAALADGVTDRGFNVRPTVLHPDPGLTTMHGLTITAPDGEQIDLRLPPGHWPLVHELLSELSSPPGARRDDPDRHPDLTAVLDAMEANGALTDLPPHTDDRQVPGVTFAGHNTVVVRSEGHAVMVDPFLRPPSARYPDSYQPLTIADLGPVDAVLLTHGHPDHFDPATLLRIPPHTPVVVPALERESILSPDLATRLVDLGFTDVRPRPWGAVERFGDVTVHVLPFLGEQPTAGTRLHPEIVNAGNTYVVRSPQQSAAFVADAGHDDRGATVDAARAHHADTGPVDVVFAGYRGWVTAPVELLRSSVGRYLLFVPPDDWGRAMTLMNDADGALDTAAAFGAPRLVPYADGGAPWFWEIGLGPRLDEQPEEREGYDPFPERVALRNRDRAAAGTDPVDVVILRPGESLSPGGAIERRPGHTWPWPPALVVS